MQWEQVCICELDNISRQWSNRLKHIWYTYGIESTIAVAAAVVVDTVHSCFLSKT